MGQSTRRITPSAAYAYLEAIRHALPEEVWRGEMEALTTVLIYRRAGLFVDTAYTLGHPCQPVRKGK